MTNLPTDYEMADEPRRVSKAIPAETKITKENNSTAWGMVFTGMGLMIFGLILLGSAEVSTPVGGYAFTGIGLQVMILGWLALAIRQK